jgi:hypothetical protein
VSCYNQTVQKTSNMYKTHHNISLGYNGVDRVRSFWKIRTRLHGTNFCINCTSSACFEISFVRQQNGPKCTQRVHEMHQNMCLWSNGEDRVHSLRKIPTRLRGTNFCINCTYLAHFEPRFIRKQSGAKCTQRLWNTPKQEFRVQWGGSGAFVAKNSDTPSWHELLH